MFTEWIEVIIKSAAEGRHSRSTTTAKSSLLLRLGTSQPRRLSLQQHSELKKGEETYCEGRSK